MGSAARHRRKFLSQHPICAFCGGKESATTIEHCPPRAMFNFREWPEGFEFPSCNKCNHGSSDQDLLVAFLARMDPKKTKENEDGKDHGLIRKVNQRFPGLIQKIMPSPSEARKQNKKLGLQPALGMTHQEVGAVKVPDEIHQAVCVLARKLSKGIYYKEIGSPFPDDGCLIMNWFTNADVIRDGKPIVFEVLKELGGKAPFLRRSNKYLNDQFEYKLTLSSEKNFIVLQARFGHSFGFVVFGSNLPGKIESSIARLRKQTEGDGPFAILQSQTLV